MLSLGDCCRSVVRHLGSALALRHPPGRVHGWTRVQRWAYSRAADVRRSGRPARSGPEVLKAGLAQGGVARGMGQLVAARRASLPWVRIPLSPPLIVLST